MQPRASRPLMPGYGIGGPHEGTGLLPWTWAEDRLIASHDYWITSTWPDGRPHVTPVWGAWFDDALWFSCGLQSRKARNLQANPRCAVATDNAQEPVLLEGTAEFVRDPDAIQTFLGASNTKYDAGMDADFLDPDVNATLRVRPQRVFGLTEADFTGSPTRWSFE